MMKLIERRVALCAEHVGEGRFQSDGVERRFGGGVRCICGRMVKNAIVLIRTDGPARGHHVYVGQRCALTVFAYQSGGMFNGNGHSTLTNGYEHAPNDNDCLL